MRVACVVSILLNKSASFALQKKVGLNESGTKVWHENEKVNHQREGENRQSDDIHTQSRCPCRTRERVQLLHEDVVVCNFMHTDSHSMPLSLKQSLRSGEQFSCFRFTHANMRDGGFDDDGRRKAADKHPFVLLHRSIRGDKSEALLRKWTFHCKRLCRWRGQQIRLMERRVSRNRDAPHQTDRSER